MFYQQASYLRERCLDGDDLWRTFGTSAVPTSAADTLQAVPHSTDDVPGQPCS